MKKYYLIIILLFSISNILYAQKECIELTLPEAIELAQKSSPDAIVARHSFRASYWNYKFFQANYLPSLTLTSNPNLNRDINKITLPNGTETFVRQNQINTDLALTINQNIWFTGGNIFVKSSAQRIDLLSDKYTSYQTSPLLLGYEHSLFGYNDLKWDKRIEPIRFTEAKKQYAETLELVASETSRLYFLLATAQTNYEIATFNYANADTLYRFAQGRYNIGTITENEMLQLEINKLSEETNMMNARIEMDNQIQELRSYLGIVQETNLKVRIEEFIPDFKISMEEAIRFANQNSPDIETMKRKKLESESNVAWTKGNTGLKADLYVQFGLTQTAEKIHAAYKHPLDQQYVSLGISIPILDWGRGKGKIKVAKSNRDLVYTQVEQERINFEMNVRKMVKQFNLQRQRVSIAARTDITAQKRHDVARKLYLLGKSTILDLNASITEKDKARRNYISALSNFWTLYYGLRSLTLYNFEKNIPITEDYNLLLK